VDTFEQDLNYSSLAGRFGPVTNHTAPAELRLRAAGLRVTAARIAVLQILDELAGHVTAEQVRQSVVDRIGGVSAQAVYDILAALTTAGLVRRLETPGQPARYESRVGDNHDHFVCRNCGTTLDVAASPGDPACLSPGALPAGFAILEAEVTYWGTCSDCLREKGREPR
jgi:Fur family ferric uptake transcriptional regulator